MPVYEKRPFSNHGNGGQWSFKCQNCRYWMDELAQLGCETRAIAHNLKWNHEVKINNAEGNTETLKRVTIDKSDKPPF